MADEDKLINVVVKYSQVDADKVAAVSAKSTKEVVNDTQSMKDAFLKLSAEQVKAWESLDTKTSKSTQKMRDDYNKLTEDQLRAWEKLKPAMGVLNDTPTKNPAAPGGPMDPAGPQRFGQEVEKATTKLHGLKQQAQSVGQVGNFLAIAGAAITVPLTASAENYVRTVGVINEKSAEWLGYQEDIKRSNLEIGEVAMEAMLPAIKLSAEFMGKIAEIIQQHPWLVQAAAVAGGAMTAVGVGTRLVSEVMRVVADMGLLMARLEASQIKQAAMLAANSAGGFGDAEYLPGGAGSLAASQAGALGTLGTVALFATSVIIGAEIGAALGNWLGKIIYGEKYKEQNLADAFVTSMKLAQLPLALLAQTIYKLDPAMSKFADKILDSLNALDSWVGGLLGANQYKSSQEDDMASIISQQEVQSFIAYQKQIASTTDQYEQMRAETITQYEQQVVAITEQYESQRSDLISNHFSQMIQEARNFARQQAEALENYNEQMADNAAAYREEQNRSQRDFQQASQRARQAHQLDMQRLEQEHNNRLQGFAAARDALGLVKENQAYAQQKAQKEQEFSLAEQQRRQEFQQQQADRRADFLRQQAEAKAHFEKQQQQAIEAHEEQVAQQTKQYLQQIQRLDAQHKLELEKLDKAEKDKLAKLQESYQKQLSLLQTAFIDRLRSLDAAILGDTKAFNKYMQDQAIAFQKWLDDFKAHADNSSGIPHGMQNGGYAIWGGAGETGRPEFVLNGSSTKLAESLIGSRLNQANLMASLQASKGPYGGGQRSLQVTVQSRDLTMSEIRSQVDHVLDQRLGELIPG